MNRREMITATLASAGITAFDIQRIAVDPDDVAIVVTPAYILPQEARMLFRQELSDAFKGTAAERLKILIFPPGWKIEAMKVPKETP